MNQYVSPKLTNFTKTNSPQMGRALSMIARRPLTQSEGLLETIATETSAPAEGNKVPCKKSQICAL